MSGETDRFSLTAEKYLGKPLKLKMNSNSKIVTSIAYKQPIYSKQSNPYFLHNIFYFAAKYHVLTYLQVRYFVHFDNKQS